MFPTHGKIECRTCFNDSNEVNECGKWRIRNDPGAWGTELPKYLVLGFSKGATQTDIYRFGDFDAVGFGGAETRTNLTQILKSIGLLSDVEQVDMKICTTEKEFHFASLVRCSLARIDDKESLKKGYPAYATSGGLIKKSFKEVAHYLENCSKKFLLDLPKSVELVVMLGSDDGYIKGVKTLIQELHPSTFKSLNAISFSAAGAIWVHVTHPSRANGHKATWLRGDQSTIAGSKRNLAEEMIRRYNLRRVKG